MSAAQTPSQTQEVGKTARPFPATRPSTSPARRRLGHAAGARRRRFWAGFSRRRLFTWRRAGRAGFRQSRRCRSSPATDAIASYLHWLLVPLNDGAAPVRAAESGGRTTGGPMRSRQRTVVLRTSSRGQADVSPRMRDVAPAASEPADSWPASKECTAAHFDRPQPQLNQRALQTQWTFRSSWGGPDAKMGGAPLKIIICAGAVFAWLCRRGAAVQREPARQNLCRQRPAKTD